MGRLIIILLWVLAIISMLYGIGVAFVFEPYWALAAIVGALITGLASLFYDGWRTSFGSACSVALTLIEIAVVIAGMHFSGQLAVFTMDQKTVIGYVMFAGLVGVVIVTIIEAIGQKSEL